MLLLKPSLFTLVTWPRYGREHPLFALMLIIIVSIALWGTRALRSNHVLGAALIALALVAYLMIGGILFSFELYATAVNSEED